MDFLWGTSPYRKAWSEETTIEYLKDNSGTIFDPEILEVFLEKVAGE